MPGLPSTAAGLGCSLIPGVGSNLSVNILRRVRNRSMGVAVCVMLRNGRRILRPSCTGGPGNGHTAAPDASITTVRYTAMSLYLALISMPARLRPAALLSSLLDQTKGPVDCAVLATCIARQHS